MTHKYTPVRPNQRLNIQADAYNAMLEAAKAHEQSKFNEQHDTTRDDRQADIVRIMNESGEDLDRFAILELTGPLITPDANANEFQRRSAFRGDIPSDGAAGKFAVLLEAIPDGRIGRAWVSGVCPVQIDVTDGGHEFADAGDGEHEHLVSGSAGSARILWKQSGTGVVWALVRLGEGAGGNRMVRFELTAGLSSGSASADFQEMDGTEIGSDTLKDPEGIFVALGAGDRGLAMCQGGEYFAVQAKCPAEESSEEVPPEEPLP